jgi:hypothetical protein
MNGEQVKTDKETGEPPTSVPIAHRHPKTLRARVKSWAWRLTAAVVLLRWLLFITGINVFDDLQTRIVSKIVSALSAIGFAPVNADYLPRVLKFTWVLIITGFSPLQVLVGLPLYIIVFPFTVIGYLVFHEALDVAPKSTQDDSRSGLRPKGRDFPLVSLTMSLLLGWFVLYGGSVSRRPVFVGLVLSGVLFLTLAYRSFLRANPVDETDTAVFAALAVKGHAIAVQTIEGVMNKPPTTKMAAISALKVGQLIYIKPFRWITLFFRGRRGRDRIAVIILSKYVVSLLFLAMSAILFWAFAMRIAVPLEATSFVTSIRLSASHFLPGVNQTSPASLPLWAEFGPALTAWILFVIYIGPAASVLSQNQKDFIRQMAPSYQLLRKTTLLWRRYRQMMELLKKRLT